MWLPSTITLATAWNQALLRLLLWGKGNCDPENAFVNKTAMTVQELLPFLPPSLPWLNCTWVVQIQTTRKIEMLILLKVVLFANLTNITVIPCIYPSGVPHVKYTNQSLNVTFPCLEQAISLMSSLMSLSEETLTSLICKFARFSELMTTYPWSIRALANFFVTVGFEWPRTPDTFRNLQAGKICWWSLTSLSFLSSKTVIRMTLTLLNVKLFSKCSPEITKMKQMVWWIEIMELTHCTVLQMYTGNSTDT